MSINIKLMFAAAIFACAIPISTYAEDSSRMKLTKVVIDPGHGGEDGGAPGCDKKTNEKDIVLSMGKALRDRIKEVYPDVEVIMTRTTDVRIDLLERAEIANRNDADLFISMHINANPSSKPNGFSAHILGESSNKKKDVFGSNLDVCKRENSVIMLEDDYTVKYAGFDPEDPSSSIIFSLMQNAYYDQSVLLSSFLVNHMNETGLFTDRGISQDNLYVLWRTAMPSVLIECGFMSNSKDLKTLKDNDSMDKIIDAIFEAFSEYKANFEGTKYVKSEKKPKEVSEDTPKETFGVQVMAGSKDLPEDDPCFKGYKARKIKSGNIYKYVIGETSDPNEAKQTQKNVEKLFTGCFVVKIEEEKISVYKE